MWLTRYLSNGMVVVMRIGGAGLRPWLMGMMAATLLVAGCSSGATTESSSPLGAVPEQYSDGPMATQVQEPAPQAPAEDSTVAKTDIVITGSIVMTVEDPTTAADKFVEATEAAGGRVESRSEQTNISSPSATLTLRIPSDQLDAVLADIDELGVVDSKNINYDDVTSQRVDLDARIEALQTSVDRLLELMAGATSTEDLLAAESSLTQRQAELDSLQSQRTQLGDQIAYATITVTLSSTPPVIAEGGFIGAIKEGWNSLVDFAGGLARTIGFLLPWTPVFLIIAGGIYALRRALKRRPRRVPPSPQPHPMAGPLGHPMAAPPVPVGAQPQPTPEPQDSPAEKPDQSPST